MQVTPRLCVDEHVVLLDGDGRASGVQAKSTVHSAGTPFHLAFSCHVVRADGSVLLARRASSKRTWPAVWSNACCGHPAAGETLREAIERRLLDELGLQPLALSLAVPDFAYRAVMADGVVEHELCPVSVALVDGVPDPDPDEVDHVEWLPWESLCERAAQWPATLSPWSVLQIEELTALGWSPAAWASGSWRGAPDRLLDRTIGVEPAPVDAPAQRRSHALDVVAQHLCPVLDELVASKGAALLAIDPALADVVAEIEGLVQAGGKRLRPAFVYWGHRATGASHEPGVLRAAAAVELLHTFALLHDDVMDRSDWRRGRPTAHRALAARHVARGAADGDWFGCSAAVLAGDLAFTWADEILDSTGLGPEAAARARAVFSTLRVEVMAGQYLDLLTAADPLAGEHAARKVALLKSARYTVTRPLLLGAALADADAAAGVSDALQVFGDAVGLAFQLRDDCLGLFGDPLLTGKSDLDDLRGGKRTLLMLRALRLATPAQRALLERSLGDPDLDDAGAEAVRDVVVRSGALASVELLLDAQHAIATDALAGIPDPARSALRELADEAIRRLR